MKIGTLVFGASTETLATEILSAEIYENFNIRTERCTIENAKTFDVILASLYWWEHKYDYVRFLKDAGIVPHKRAPFLVVGGMEMANPRSMHGFYDYCCLGDGETVITEIISAIIDKREPSHSSVWIDGVENTEKGFNSAEELHAACYVENRKSQITRIEIARGCKRKCLFCLVSFVKPYRELQGEVIKSLIGTSATRKVAMFAPDRGLHSAYGDIEKWVQRYRKVNAASDIRLDQVQNVKYITQARFGLEAFTPRVRRAIGKQMSDDEIVSAWGHLVNVARSAANKPVTTATLYMIMGLPNDRGGMSQFADLLRRLDSVTNSKFTLFLSFSTFAPYFFTPLQWAATTPYENLMSEWMAVRPRLDKITIAQRGGFIQPAKQMLQMLTIRGDERAAKAIYHFATNQTGKAMVKERGAKGGKYFESVLEKCGIDPRLPYREIGKNESLPWDGIRSFFPRPALEKMYDVYMRRVG